MRIWWPVLLGLVAGSWLGCEQTNPQLIRDALVPIWHADAAADQSILSWPSDAGNDGLVLVPDASRNDASVAGAQDASVSRDSGVTRSDTGVAEDTSARSDTSTNADDAHRSDTTQSVDVFAEADMARDSRACSCEGKCAGADDGCGGSCGADACAGCCIDQRCVTFAAQQHTQCGAEGNRCVDCRRQGSICDAVSHRCARNDASFVQQVIPSSLQPGESFEVSVTFRNTGTSHWRGASGHRLGAQNPRDNRRWGIPRVIIGGNGAVPPGSRHTFKFKITAPEVEGVYPFQWRMLQERVEWFGQFGPVGMIVVHP